MKLKSRLSLMTLSLILLASPAGRAHDIDIEKLKRELKAEILRELAAEKETPKQAQNKVSPKAQPKNESDAKNQTQATQTKIPADKKHWTDIVKFSGQVRVRTEGRRNLRAALPAVPEPREEDLSVLLRTRLGAEFLPTEHVSFFIQGQDSRDFGEEVAALPTIAGDDEGFDLHQGYIDLKKLGNKPINVRLGRQEISFGDQRLVGAVDWSNVGRSFDAVRFTYDPEAWQLNAFASIADRTGVSNLGDGQYFGGLYATDKKFLSGVLDGYYFLLQDNDGAAGAAAGTGNTQSVHTLGGRYKAAFSNGIDVGIESAVQLGKYGSNSILAFAEHAMAGYTFSPSWKPRVGLEYNFATGDNTTSGRYTKFNNLFPTNHNKYGFMDIFAWSNMHDGVVSLSAKPGKWQVGADYHLFMVDKNNSGADNIATYAGGPGLGKVFGHEVDLLAKWTLNEYFNVLGGYSHFIPGSYLKDQGMSTSSDFFYIQAQGQFN